MTDKNSSSNVSKHHFHRTSLCAFQPFNKYVIEDSGEKKASNVYSFESPAKDYALKGENYSYPISTENLPEIQTKI